MGGGHLTYYTDECAIVMIGRKITLSYYVFSRMHIYRRSLSVNKNSIMLHCYTMAMTKYTMVRVLYHARYSKLKRVVGIDKNAIYYSF